MTNQLSLPSWAIHKGSAHSRQEQERNVAELRAQIAGLDARIRELQAMRADLEAKGELDVPARRPGRKSRARWRAGEKMWGGREETTLGYNPTVLFAPACTGGGRCS